MSAIMETRKAVYRAIDGERNYQDSRWNADTTPTEGKHTVAEWLVYMRSYLREAEDQCARKADPEATIMALNTIRKITTMGVACMEQNGAPQRKGFEIEIE